MNGDAGALAARLVARDKAALGRAVTLFEDPRAAAAPARAALLAGLAGRPVGAVVGVTGAPGVGKSTLIGELAVRLVEGPGLAVAVLAVDPSSPTSGGAFLGDRARTRFPPDERRLFFRSQASARELGGLAPTSFAVTRLLTRLFDVVVVETVGVGQSEIEVSRLADVTCVVVQPMTGDELQFLKAGVMEVADRVVLGKCDLAGAARTRSQLASALALGRARAPALHVVSARTGEGIEELVEALVAAAAASAAVGPGGEAAGREAYFLARWVAGEYGRVGAAALDEQGGATAILAESGSFEAAQERFRRAHAVGGGGGGGGGEGVD